MINRIKVIGKITFLILLCIIILTPTSLGGVNGNLYLVPDGGIYTTDLSWDDETYVTGLGNFNLNIVNHHQHDSVYILYIITAVNMDPSITQITATINSIPVTDWIPADGSKPVVPTDPTYQYPTTIYKTGTWYNITRIDLDSELGPNSQMTIPIFTSSPSSVKIHFDGAGADEFNKAFVCVPSSHDAMSQIPEFPTVALPIAAILGIMFVLQSRRRKED